MSPGQGVLLKSDVIALPFRAEVQSTLSEVSHPATLVGILSTDSKPSRFYADFTKVRSRSIRYGSPV